MARRGIMAIFVAVLVFSFASVAWAQDVRPYMIYGHIGYAKMLEDGAPDGSVGFGGGVAYMLPSMPSLAVGGEVSWLLLGSYDVFDETRKDSVIPVTGQVTYFIERGSSAVPFVTAGAGFYQYRVTDGETFTDGNGGINFGGGVKIETDKQVSYGAEARIHIVFTEDDSTNLLTVMGKVFF
jgi:hypothetical protein